MKILARPAPVANIIHCRFIDDVSASVYLVREPCAAGESNCKQEALRLFRALMNQSIVAEDAQ